MMTSIFEDVFKNKPSIKELHDLHGDKIFKNKKELNILVGKILSGQSQKSNIKCMHLTCDQPPIGSHSIQKAKLKLISDSKNEVYYFKSSYKHLEKPIPKIDKINIASASVFPGFCGVHDKELFQIIEDNEIDPNNKHHTSLLVYRALAKSIIDCEQIVNHYKLLFNEIRPKEISDDLNLALLVDNYLQIVNLTHLQNRFKNLSLDIILKQFTATDIETISIEIPNLLSIASVSHIQPKELLGKIESIQSERPSIYLTILPKNENKTLLIASYHMDKSTDIKPYLHKILSENNIDFPELSKMLLSSTDNLMISPKYWETLSEEEKAGISEYYSYSTFFNDAEFNPITHQIIKPI
ncbi:hypothetical protein [Leptospira bandrabouensis]|uniref:Uncharacterized protein n=1 Tax=Leptospira bandrabouensis TaxID=2484903 RepID=A0A6H3NVB6_9LEPT|nr:hypothetical protein [Leptospira bandrabouensis]TGN16845.1 hypothetical protein EHR08_00070 [Leptospira bandrabouensis]